MAFDMMLRNAIRYEGLIGSHQFVAAARLLGSVLQNDTRGRLFLAQYYVDNGNYPQAAIVLSAEGDGVLGARFQPIGEARLLWSIIQVELGHYRDALGALMAGETSLTLDPMFAENNYALACYARLLGLTGQPERGLALLTDKHQIRQEYSTDPDVHMAAAELYLIGGDPMSAREVLAALMSHPGYRGDVNIELLLQRVARALEMRVASEPPRGYPPSIDQVMAGITALDKMFTANSIHPHLDRYLRAALEATLSLRPRHVLVVGSEFVYLGEAIRRLGIDVIQLTSPEEEEGDFLKHGPLSQADSFLKDDSFDLIIMAYRDEDETGPMERALGVMQKLISHDGVLFLPNIPMKSGGRSTTPYQYCKSHLKMRLERLPYKLWSPRYAPKVWLDYLDLILDPTYSRAYRVSKLQPGFSRNAEEDAGHPTSRTSA